MTEVFGLYWWRPTQNWVNLGDEISPLILAHVTGRKIVHANLDTCDGIAIGSIFYPRKASARKRKTPLFIWGSGTLEPRPCKFANLSVSLAALRGPRTAGQIEGCPDVPFGDAGLFVRELWPAGKTPSGKIGLIPHHSLLRRNEVREMAEALGDTVIIDFTDPDFAKTLRILSECRVIVSSSLHGLILADAYGVPSLFWNELGAENEWKYQDYFEGVGRPDYRAMTAAEIVKTASGGRADDLPFSLLPEAAYLSCLSDLRQGAVRIAI